MKDKEKEIQSILANMSDNFDIMADGQDFQTQMEYMEQSHSFGYGELTEQETFKLGSMLTNKHIRIDGKKRALSILAHLGTVSAFRQIEQYSKNPDEELLQWTRLALRECRMFLENSLGDESNGLIITGMGGVGERLRYYFFVLPLMEQSFNILHKDIIRDEFTIVCQDFNSIIETFHYSDNYVGLTILMPMDVAIGKLIDTGIQKCNELGVFVLESYYVTNMEVPEESEIPDIIKIILEGKPE